MALRRIPRLVLTLALAIAPATDFFAQASRGPVPLLDPESTFGKVPFQQGEEVRYEINWKPLFLFPSFKAGEVRLTIEKTEYAGRDAYKISAWAASDGLLKSVAGLDVKDYFESTIDGGNFRSQRFFQQTRQNSRQRDLEVTIDYSAGQAHVKEFDVSADPPRQLRNEVRGGIPSAVVDTLSVFYAVRLRQLKPGDQYVVHLSDNGKIQDVKLEVVSKQRLQTGLGRFETFLITTRGGVFNQGGDFRIWYTRDDLRVPVRFEADVKFGKVFGELIQLTTPQLVKSRVRVD